jgi:hypothetical protein
VRPHRPAHTGIVARGAWDHAQEALAHMCSHARWGRLSPKLICVSDDLCITNLAWLHDRKTISACAPSSAPTWADRTHFFLFFSFFHNLFST